MYRITYTQGNGYHCGCCRKTSTETIDYETKEEVIEWLSELEACNTESEWEDDDDRSLDEIKEIINACGTGVEPDFLGSGLRYGNGTDDHIGDG